METIEITTTPAGRYYKRFWDAEWNCMSCRRISAKEFAETKAMMPQDRVLINKPNCFLYSN